MLTLLEDIVDGREWGIIDEEGDRQATLGIG
jgi:hypothetical protein